MMTCDVAPLRSLGSGSRNDATSVGAFVAPVLIAVKWNAEGRSAVVSMPEERAASSASPRARAPRSLATFKAAFGLTTTPGVAASASIVKLTFDWVSSDTADNGVTSGQLGREYSGSS